MILASLADSNRYEHLHPLFKEAFDFVKSTDFSKLETGRFELKGDNLYVNYVDMNYRSIADALIETHRDYIDIQIPVDTMEEMGWKPAADLQFQKNEYDEENDISFFQDQSDSMFCVNPGQFVIFFPEDAHLPAIGSGCQKKKIIKVHI